MALAVAEAHRVLRPGGQLLDIHPEGAPSRLELWQPLSGQSSETQEPEAYARRNLGDLAPESRVADFIATTQAMADALQHGFALGASVTFDYRFFFDTLDDLTTYLEENEELDLAGDDLLEQALLGLQQSSTPAQLVLVQRVNVTRLLKR